MVIVVILMSCIILGGAVWTLAREMFFWKSSVDQHELLKQFNSTIEKQTECVQAQFEDAERRIDRFEGMSAGQKQELVRLILDTERRIVESMRDIMRQAAGVTIQNSTGSSSANQAGHNHHEQQ